MARRRDHAAPDSDLPALIADLAAAYLAGDEAAGNALGKLARTGTELGQMCIDAVMGWHRHPGAAGSCLDESCPGA